ncbi:hypothetical protein RJY99_002256 [Vibrio vulnificus]|nr:hypothetical protein [Vibrio vulnificus]ELV8662358.1 hypothetical protein [Vibrio vulnificus]
MDSVILIIPVIVVLSNLLLNGFESVYFLFPTILSSLLLADLISRTIKLSTIFHPVPFVSLMLIWSMVCAPYVAYGSGYNIALPPKEIDWLIWQSATSHIYFLCILLYYLGARMGFSTVCKPKKYTFRNKSNVIIISAIFLSLSLTVQILVFEKFGGISGYVDVWSDDRMQFKGLGFFLIIAEAFPILLAFFILYTYRDDRKSLYFFVGLILVFFILKLVFGGMRGSRSNTIWGLFWLGGVIHISYYRFKKIHFIAGATFLVAFMSIYSLYKSFGMDGFSGEYTIEDTGRYEGNPVLGVLVTDFSRTGEHSYILHEYFNTTDYDIKYGNTYISSLFKLIPGVDSPFGKVDKNFAGAQLFYGHYNINPDHSYFYNSRIYGLYGEGLLNFGPILPIFLFFFVGALIGIIHKFSISISYSDPRIYIVPFVSNLCLMLLLADSDNIIFFAFKNGLFVILFIFLILKVERNIRHTSFKEV